MPERPPTRFAERHAKRACPCRFAEAAAATARMPLNGRDAKDMSRQARRDKCLRCQKRRSAKRSSCRWQMFSPARFHFVLRRYRQRASPQTAARLPARPATAARCVHHLAQYKSSAQKPALFSVLQRVKKLPGVCRTSKRPAEVIKEQEIKKFFQCAKCAWKERRER